MNNVTILPVFNQTPEIWSIMADIKVTTIKSVYDGYPIPPNQMIHDAIMSFRNSWNSNINNFNFIAFYENKPVGFIRGDGNYIHSLFVLKKYAKIGIGTNLLMNAEIINYNYKNSMRVNSLTDSLKFYNKNGYFAPTGHVLTKNLESDFNNDYIIPLFNAKYKIERIHNISSNSGIKLSENSICFGHFKDKEIYGYITENDNKIICETFNNKSAKETILKLHKAFNEYKKKSCLLNSIYKKQLCNTSVF